MKRYPEEMKVIAGTNYRSICFGKILKDEGFRVLIRREQGDEVYFNHNEVTSII